MILLAIAALSFHPNFDLTSGSTASTAESTVYSQQLLKGLPAGATEPSQVYVRSDHDAPLSTGRLASYRTTLSEVPGVGQPGLIFLLPIIMYLFVVALGTDYNILILAGTFASLMLAGNSMLTPMGFAIAFGIAIAAFVMALFFTPALTALIGHAAWWPGHGDTARRPTAPDGDTRQSCPRCRPCSATGSLPGRA